MIAFEESDTVPSGILINPEMKTATKKELLYVKEMLEVWSKYLYD